jgi:general secretion pathway protein G
VRAIIAVNPPRWTLGRLSGPEWRGGVKPFFGNYECINEPRCLNVLGSGQLLSRLFYILGVAVFGLAIFVGTFVHPSIDVNRRRQVRGYVAIRRLTTAVERYKADCGQYPSLTGGLDALPHSPGVACWRGPYLDGEVPADPWGRAFVYRSYNLGPEVVSYGADGKPGGEFFDMDTSSRDMWVLSPQTPTEIKTRRIWIAVWFGAWVGLLACGHVLWMNRRQFNS